MTETKPPTPRVLIVDDDRAVLHTYARALHEYSPLQTDDAVAAQQILSETPVDVVVSDLEMPRLSGLDLMKWAKEHCPHSLWIVVSGQGTLDSAIEALKLGAFDFVCKPLQSPVQLQTVVANAVRYQTLIAERMRLLCSLADNNLRLVDSHRKLEAANTELHDRRTMLDQDLLRARRILRALLPHSLRPLVKMHVNVAYRPSTVIGGDFYGAAMLDDRNLAVYVADAAGHGVSAALLAVLFNQQLSSLVGQTGVRSPTAILCDLNRGLWEECRASGLFVTAAYALIDTVARTATIASAGHPPAILLHATGLSQQLEKTGPALGLTPDAQYWEHEVSLAEGDRLLLYTDGFSAAISENAPNLDTIFASVATRAEDGATVIDSLLTWTEHNDDDVTLLLLTASSGVSVVDGDAIASESTLPTDSSLSLGSDQETTWVIVRGRATWKDAVALRDSCIETLDAGRAVIVDLGACVMLDSTLLGTLHELALHAQARGSFHVQNASDRIRELFVELAMSQVLASISLTARPVPAATVVQQSAASPSPSLILQAHESLAALSASNAEQFQPVIDELKNQPMLIP